MPCYRAIKGGSEGVDDLFDAQKRASVGMTKSVAKGKTYIFITLIIDIPYLGRIAPDKQWSRAPVRRPRLGTGRSRNKLGSKTRKTDHEASPTFLPNR